ncbi:BA14K family protein [Pseudorhizobium pelagicum]|uniref:BA14K family protein n=1 Tax=Pseudorhizobium pelagicum TaxID=1509405 RepID=UPI0009DF47F3|nr:BA14K family protein [Pseudorhizobium pelagicum]
MKFATTMTAGIMSALILATSIAPAGAVTLPSLSTPQMSAAEHVQFRNNDRDRRRVDRDDRRRGEYRGYRGSRERRQGYRRHSDGFWYPLAAFGAAAIIGGAIANQPGRPQASSSRHIQWCSDRYRTYRASDNTYVPRVGVRAYCSSPYSR